MCGFVGLYDIKSQYKFEIKKALKKIYHRGPDGQSVKVLEDGTFTLGFARLAIIDLTEAGGQPMTNQSGTITLVFNGEIYNYKELKGDLIKKGYAFFSQSDTEVLLHMYEEYGISMLEHLEGMYGIAIVDQEKEELYLIRDRIGIKPLYYSNGGDAVGFGSEVKVMFDLPNVSKKISCESIAEFLQNEYIHAPNTLFCDIKKLLPGHYIKVHKGKMEDIEYWDCRNLHPMFVKTEEARQRIIEYLKKSLELHLRSDVPIGIYLSGGIDSGILAAIASERVPIIDTFTLKFEDGDFDESHLAELIAKRYKTNHHCITVTAQDMKTLLPEMLWYCDDLLGDSGILPNYIISNFAAKEGIKVVISGAGGDELFAGYNYYFGSKKEQLVCRFPKTAGIMSRLVKNKNPELSQKIEAALLVEKSPEKHMVQSQRIFEEDELDKLLFQYNKRRNFKLDYYNDFCETGLNALLYTDIKTYLPDDLMLLADRTTMAHSVEGRIPFLYRPLVEFAMSMPENVKTPGKQRKWLLRDIAKEYLPEEVLRAPKMGFCSPIAGWAKGDFGEYAFHVLNSRRSKSRPYWNLSIYEEIVSDKENYKNYFSKIYLLLVLEIYMRVHVDNDYLSSKEINVEEIYG